MGCHCAPPRWTFSLERVILVHGCCLVLIQQCFYPSKICSHTCRLFSSFVQWVISYKSVKRATNRFLFTVVLHLQIPNHLNISIFGNNLNILYSVEFSSYMSCSLLRYFPHTQKHVQILVCVHVRRTPLWMARLCGSDVDHHKSKKFPEVKSYMITCHKCTQSTSVKMFLNAKTN